MKMSKGLFYVILAGYCLALAVFLDFYESMAYTGVMAMLFQFKLVLDLGFATIALVRLATSRHTTAMQAHDVLRTLNQEEDSVFEIKESRGFDITYYLCMLFYVLAHSILHTIWNMTATGVESAYYLLWFIADVALLVLAVHRLYVTVGGVEVKLVKRVV
jgi:hypothetical protein